MPVEPSDLTIHSNEWFTQTLRLLNSDKVTPIDLTGFSAVCEIGAFKGCDAPLITATVGDGITIEPTEGRVSVMLTTARLVSAGVVMGAVYKYKLSILSPDGQPRVYRHGKLKVIC